MLIARVVIARVVAVNLVAIKDLVVAIAQEDKEIRAVLAQAIIPVLVVANTSAVAVGRALAAAVHILAADVVKHARIDSININEDTL